VVVAAAVVVVVAVAVVAVAVVAAAVVPSPCPLTRVAEVDSLIWVPYWCGVVSVESPEFVFGKVEVMGYPQENFPPAFSRCVQSRISVKSSCVRATELRQVAQHFVPEGIEKRLDVSGAPAEKKITCLLDQTAH
jgi:hypothetical protein